MRNLGATLAQVLPSIESLGGEGVTVDRKRLETALDRLVGDLTRVLYVRLGVVLLVIAVLLTMMVVFYRDPAIFVAMTGGAGLSIGGAIALLKQVTDEMTRTRLLLALVPSLSLESLTEIAQRLSTELVEKQAGRHGPPGDPLGRHPV